VSVRRAARRAALAAVTLGTIVVPAAPANADAPRPTNYRSEVTGAEPALPAGVHARVVGGDSFFELSVADGHTAVVPDYSSDAAEPVPYLRFRRDGTVQRNRRALATAANESRTGQIRRTTDPGDVPSWETIATDGTYAWHDHRIHWMAPRPPRQVAADGQVDMGGPGGRWEVPLVVDGAETVVVGHLWVEPPPPSWAWFGFVAVVAVAGWLVASRIGARAGDGVNVVAALAAVVAASATWQAVPAGAGASALPFVVTVVTLVAAVLAVTSRGTTGLVASAAAAAGLLGWGITRASVLTHAVLATTLPFGLDRLATAIAIGAGLATAVRLVWPQTLRSNPTA